jgi:hypothetical protein
MARLGTFKLGQAKLGGDVAGDYDDYATNITMGAAASILRAGGRIEIADEATDPWTGVLVAEWIEPAAENGLIDPRPGPHPDWV